MQCGRDGEGRDLGRGRQVGAAGGATTFEALQRRVWGPGRGDPQAVRSAVTKLRRKLGDDARNPKYILGERGLGYRMPEPDGP